MGALNFDFAHRFPLDGGFRAIFYTLNSFMTTKLMAVFRRPFLEGGTTPVAITVHDE